MGLRDFLPGYQDPFGIMQDRNHVVDGNALLYTGTMLVLLSDEEDFPNVDDRLTFARAIAEAEIQPGLLMKYSKPADQESHDDYVGMAAASALIDNGNFAKRVLRFGRSHKYGWDNLNTDDWSFRDFFVRFPGWWAHMKSAAGEWLNPIDQLWSFIDLVGIVFYEDGASGTLMTYLRYKTFTQKSSAWLNPLTRLGCVIFKTAYLRRHPKGIKESYAEYFGPNYPFSQLPDGKF